MDGIIPTPSAEPDVLAVQEAFHIYIFARPGFAPAFQLATRRFWFREFDAALLTARLEDNPMRRVMELARVSTRAQGYFGGAMGAARRRQLTDVLVNNCLKTYRLYSRERALLTHPGSGLLLDMRQAANDIDWRSASATPRQIRHAIAAELSRLLAARSRQKESWDAVFRSEPWYSQALIVAGAAATGAREMVESWWDTAVVTVDLIGEGSEATLHGAQAAYRFSMQIRNDLLQGNLAQLQARVKALGGQVRDGTEGIKRLLREAERVLKVLFADPGIGRMLIEYGVAYADATAVTEKVRNGFRIGCDLLLAIGLAVVTGGAGLAAAAANAARSFGMFSARLVEMLARAYRLVKKSRVASVPVPATKPRMLIDPGRAAQNRAPPPPREPRLEQGGGQDAGTMAGRNVVPDINSTRMFSPNELMGVEPASPDLLVVVSSKRDVVIAQPGSQELRMLDYFGAEASVGTHVTPLGKEIDNGSILLRQNPSKAAVLEEFLHGTQARLGITERLGRSGMGSAETHVKDFMIRHQKMLGLGDEDVQILQILRDKGM